MKKFILILAFALSFSSIALAQNRFEGYNLFLDAPENHRQSICATRYVPPTTDIIISDLNPATPMNVKSCAGSNTGARVTRSSATTAIANASQTDYKWCFEGEDKRYRISFKGDQFSGNKTYVYDWIATPEAKNLGNYNVRDFGAIGDGRADDTIAFRSALAFMTVHNGGILNVPEGDYVISAPLTLASGITIQGINGLPTSYPTNNVNVKNPSRLRLSGTRGALFRIGECTYKVALKNLELYADSNEGTYGVEAVGGYTASQDISFEQVSFSLLNRGIYVHGLEHVSFAWQFDYIKVRDCLFIYNRDAGIYVKARNSGWTIEGSFFMNPKRQPGQNADSIYMAHASGLLVQNTYSGGFSGAIGGTFLNIVDCGNITVIQSQAEAMTNAFVYNEPEFPYHGDYSYPIVFINNSFGDRVDFRGRRTFISTGNQYLGNTIKAGPELRVYSTGDRFCYDGTTLGCVNGAKASGNIDKSSVFDRATVVFMSGQPDDAKGVKGHPTFFGTDVQFGAPVQMPSFPQNQMPQGKANGSMVYCTNCRRSTTPCQAGGSGAPAMVVGGQWSCL
ncbi:MAG TPA: glycosyl hydrolase family 28-related protein [Pyrinomonadaceae bacterium]|nr:glycosyl hydrolase family 28-related protein [Pyrinomonadaceae bacterium]